jgi:hypothetical protein
MPAYAFEAVLSQGGRTRPNWVTVDASYGGFAMFGRIEELAEGGPEGDRFPTVIEQAEAEELARDGLVRYILRKRGAKPAVEGIERGLLYYAPFWVYYFRRLGGKIDFSVLDAYTGDRAGARMRQAIINGLIAMRRP